MTAQAALGVALVFLLVADVFLVAKGRRSISRWFWDQAHRRPFVIFLLGYVMGHLTWPGEDCLRFLQSGGR